MKAKSKITLLTGGLFTVLLVIAQPAAANDQAYADDNEYFASKYHHRHPHHWKNEQKMGVDAPTFRGRDRRHGIHLDGHDGGA